MEQIINWTKVLDVSVVFVPAALIGTTVMTCLKYRQRIKEDQAYIWVDIIISVSISLFLTVAVAFKFEQLDRFWTWLIAGGSALGGTPIAVKLRKYAIKQPDHLPDNLTDLT
ncbi:hypothetical protein [Siphonobacter curvatus]|uniref:Holin n=1 Tax=Siphonobacter curvatus TaxID=2094562 RepID=A0A2S7IR48_9BACT|nr:hypothetical protein [Siphonobacter curvatus]PQA60185.1 hypothetical protein C5O19_11360 [Siphonobacter curvatus]